jgi:hypothetical protein
LQNPSQTNRDNLNNVRRETNRTFREKREYPKKINELDTNRKNENSKEAINEFKKDYRPKTNIVKNENSDVCRLPQYFEQIVELLLSAIQYAWCQ